ncbi:MAG: NfeD family protein [Verrucomicrobiota bacterium JB024]|nr:NfeD family protein [Verrucomicrobiota bacterium JB024]
MVPRVYLLAALLLLSGPVASVWADNAAAEEQPATAPADSADADNAQASESAPPAETLDEQIAEAEAPDSPVVGDMSPLTEADPADDSSDATDKAPAPESFADEPAPSILPMPADGYDVYVVPIKGAIGPPQLYILRRALKDAIANGVETVILQMDTPGGRVDTTLEMMEALDNFEGETITFVDKDAISAGSYIAVATDAIYFAPKGKMGAAEAVTGNGQDIDESMQRKVSSYLRAVVRVLSETHRYRADVQRAMMDPAYVLEIDGHEIKPAGELLTLTATEAAREYGNPPQPLLAAGIVDSVDQLLDQRYGPGNYHVREFHLSWSEEFAKWFSTIAPVLISIGILLIIIEIKTPNFGLLGGLGIALVILAFLGNTFAGLAGNEPILLFFVGVILIALELFFFPGVIVVAALGLLSIVAAIVWSMADIWPTPDGGVTISGEALAEAFQNALIAVILAGIGLAILWRFLPSSPLFRRFISVGAVGGVSEVDAHGGSSSSGQTTLPDLGARGTVVRDLHPTGIIEIDGQQYQAKCAHGEIKRGQPVIVVQRGSFALVVEPADNAS